MSDFPFGSIIEYKDAGKGGFNELLTVRGLYWRLYQLQYSEEKIHVSEPGLIAADSAIESGI